MKPFFRVRNANACSNVVAFVFPIRIRETLIGSHPKFILKNFEHYSRGLGSGRRRRLVRRGPVAAGSDLDPNSFLEESFPHCVRTHGHLSLLETHSPLEMVTVTYSPSSGHSYPQPVELSFTHTRIGRKCFHNCTRTGNLYPTRKHHYYRTNLCSKPFVPTVFC